MRPLSAHPSAPRARRLCRIAVAGVVAVMLAGCAASPEAARVRGEPGADPGNHGNPVELIAPPDEFARVYYGIPYEGPAAASEDTAQR
jgi:hypothetical protein